MSETSREYSEQIAPADRFEARVYLDDESGLFYLDGDGPRALDFWALRDSDQWTPKSAGLPY